MNIDNFRIARGWVAQQEHFDMNEWVRKPGGFPQHCICEGETFPCGTAACLAGTIAIRVGGKGYTNEIAQSFLGLSQLESEKLFEWPSLYGKDTLGEVTKDDVLAKLDEIITAGEFK